MISPDNSTRIKLDRVSHGESQQHGATGAAFERHFTVKELAERWHLDQSTVRRLFIDRTGVFKIGEKRLRTKRQYISLRIPESVAEQVYLERAS